MTSKKWIATLVVCAVTPFANAQNVDSFQHRFEIGVDYGQAEQAYSHSKEDGQIDEHDTGFRVFSSYYFTPSVAVRLGYADLGEVTLYDNQYYDAYLNVNFDELSAQSNPTAITLGGVFTLPINQSPFVFGVEFGLTEWNIDYTTTDIRSPDSGGTQETTTTYSSSDIGFYGGGELSYQFNQQFAIGLSALWYTMEPEINNSSDFDVVVQSLNLRSVIRF